MSTEEREISLIDLLIYVAKGWKSILIWMLIMAVLVGAVQYVREVQAVKVYESSLPSSEEEEKEQTISTLAQLREQMTDEEIMGVSKVVRLEKEYAMQLEYNDNAMLMNMNPYDVSIARIRYAVETDYVTNYAGVTHKDKTDDIVDGYIDYLEGSDWKKQALKEAGVEADVQYFGELVNLGDYGDSFLIVIKHSDEKELKKMLPILNEAVETAKVQLKKVYGSHEVKLVNESVEVTVDNDIYNSQQNRKNTLLNLENNIASYKNAFNDNQKSLYAGELLVNEDQTEESQEAADAAEGVLAEAPAEPQLRVKNLLLGAVLGAFLICMLRAMVYILSGKLKAEDNVEAYLGIAGLGLIAENKTAAKGAAGKIDAWLDSLSKRNMGNLTKEQQIKMAASNILLYCEKGNMKEIYLNSSVNCVEAADELIKLLKERGIAVKEGFSILQDALAMEEMSKADGVVFVEQAGKSRYEDLEREVKLCKEHEKMVIGLVVLS